MTFVNLDKNIMVSSTFLELTHSPSSPSSSSSLSSISLIASSSLCPATSPWRRPSAFTPVRFDSIFSPSLKPLFDFSSLSPPLSPSYSHLFACLSSMSSSASAILTPAKKNHGDLASLATSFPSDTEELDADRALKRSRTTIQGLE